MVEEDDDDRKLCPKCGRAMVCQFDEAYCVNCDVDDSDVEEDSDNDLPEVKDE